MLLPLEANRRPVLLLFLLGMVYTFGFLFWYSGTALGLSPVLDGRENIELAQAIAAGELSSEPFYRAMLYPALLSIFAKLGVSADILPLVARLLNGAFHLLTAALLFRMALQLWRSVPIATFAALLWMFNPVALHFAGDPLDITLAICLGTAGLAFWLRAMIAHPQFIRLSAADTTEDTVGSSLRRKGRHALVHPAFPAGMSSLFLVLAFATRPHYLPVLLLAPIILWPRTKLGALAAIAVAILGLGSIGWINQARSGEFVILPTQGAFNLWAANREGAHGRYFTQTLQIENTDELARNPARAESEILYARAHNLPADTDVDVREMNSYWRERARRSILDAPIRWLGLELRKAYYLINDHEIYNNKTYAFHKERSPWLKYNPISWGLLFAFGAAGLVFLWRIRTARWLLLLGCAYAGGVALYYASARFRLPLATFATLFAAGAPAGIFSAALRSSGSDNPAVPFGAPQTGNPIFNYQTPARFITALAVFAAAVLVSFSPLFDVKDPQTVLEDKLLLAHANADLANDADALQWAEAVLEERPDHPAALELAVLSDFNLRLIAARARAEQRLEADPGLPPAEDWISRPVTENELARAARAAEFSAPAKFVYGVYLHKTGNTREAVRLWEPLVNIPRTHDSAIFALAITGHLDATTRPQFQDLMHSGQPAGQLLALEEILNSDEP